jgi:hypothetical protein
MADPVLGTDVIIQFLHNDNYINYGCATNVEIQFDMETKSVKTIGDGIWKRKRGQSLGAVINLSGVIVNNTAVPTVFNLLAYFKQMVDVQYRIRFTDNGGGVQVIDGDALPTSVKLAGGTDGFATGDITLECNGDPDYITPPAGPDPGDPNACIAEIETAHMDSNSFPNRRYVFVDSMVSGSAEISRWDYLVERVLGGYSSGLQTAFTDGNIPTTWRLPIIAGTGNFTITITPICDNGFPGVPFTINFTN